ncbi:hypothetical protein [Pseudodesulfovibrio tunisiensis]|uniref:hypothetical protein n=1 Tax=Pseudodesulfovibrio tunisiensis TaxID=463192 RepID=UPI001FB52C26|nr:hypothetical protein [Pseudodesulfovibrio tunisiensis]
MPVKTCGYCENFEEIPMEDSVGKCDPMADELAWKYRGMSFSVQVRADNECKDCPFFEGNDEYDREVDTELAEDMTREHQVMRRFVRRPYPRQNAA